MKLIVMPKLSNLKKSGWVVSRISSKKRRSDKRKWLSSPVDNSLKRDNASLKNSTNMKTSWRRQMIATNIASQCAKKTCVEEISRLAKNSLLTDTKNIATWNAQSRQLRRKTNTELPRWEASTSKSLASTKTENEQDRKPSSTAVTAKAITAWLSNSATSRLWTSLNAVRNRSKNSCATKITSLCLSKS